MKFILISTFLFFSCAKLSWKPPIDFDIGKPPIELPVKKPTFPWEPQPQPQPEKPKDQIKDQDPTIEIAIVNAINHARVVKGLDVLSIDNKLGCGAQIHAEDIGPKNICGHKGSDGSNPTERLARCDYRGGWGEIVACGQKSPEKAVNAWHNSPGHAAIMYSNKYTHVGAYMINNYWVAVFR